MDDVGVDSCPLKQRVVIPLGNLLVVGGNGISDEFGVARHLVNLE